MKRVFVCGLAQESNSFNPVPMSMKSFYPIRVRDSSASMITGIKKVLAEENIELVSGISMTASSGSLLEDAVIDYFLEVTLKDLDEVGEIDGILFAMHGATMCESYGDACGEIFSRIRKKVGEDIPMSAAFDLHANITEKVMENVDYVCGYLEYPHIDLEETSKRAARMLSDHLKGKVRKTARAAIPMIAPAHAYTTQKGSLKALKEKAKKLVSDGRISDYSIFQVQPWLDTEEMASCAVVIADDEKTAKETAYELALCNFEIREELLGEPLTTIDQVIEKALANKSGKPVILVDSADSCGAGSTADSAAVLGAMLPYKDVLCCATSVVDIPTVDKAFEVGVGNRADFSVGASVAPELSKPVLLKDALVRSLHTGVYTQSGPIGTGQKGYHGKCAVLEVGKILVLVTYHGGSGRDLNYFHSFGIDPRFCDLISVKACTSFRAAYEPIASEIYNTNTPGAACPVLTDLNYKRRPKPMYPFEEISVSDVTEGKCYR